MLLLNTFLLLLIAVCAIVILYIILGLIIPWIPVNIKQYGKEKGEQITVYLKSDGIHADFIMPAIHSFFDWSVMISKGEYKTPFKEDSYVCIGWGDKGFYLDIPTWSELTFKIAFKAMCVPSPTVMHVTSYSILPEGFKYFRAISLSKHQYLKLCSYISSYFTPNNKGESILIPGVGYSDSDNFYLANDSYHALYTCNEWINRGLKELGIKTALWSPAAFGLFVHQEPKDFKILSSLIPSKSR